MKFDRAVALDDAEWLAVVGGDDQATKCRLRQQAQSQRDRAHLLRASSSAGRTAAPVFS